MSERLRREGDWPAAEALLQESIDLSTALGQEAGVAYARLACLLSYRGDEPATVQALSSARAEFAATQELWHPVWLAQAEGALALTLGRPRDAIQALDPVRSARFLGRGARDAVALGLVDLVEAYRAVGATAAAGDTCQELSDRLDGIVDPFGLAIVARCRALTSRTGADDLFAEALACHGRTSDAFELARTQLHLGEHLRRSRRPKQARTPLSRALAAFERLGVEPWAERARRELRASGEVVAPPPGTSAESLTPQELRVAMAVREGMTNEAVSQALFLSVKTVEFHLGRVYRKLGIRSRGGLASGMERAGIR
jgi:DNA-binding CsgD family transcriptional regulator